MSIAEEMERPDDSAFGPGKYAHEGGESDDSHWRRPHHHSFSHDEHDGAVTVRTKASAHGR